MPEQNAGPEIVAGQEYTSKVASVLNIRDGKENAQHPEWGIPYYFDLRMENGHVGSLTKKKRDAIKEGMEITYTIQVNGNFTNFKEVQKNKGGFGGGGGRSGPAYTDAQIALQCAVTSFVERNKSEPTRATPTELATGVSIMADKYLVWLKANS